MENRAKGTIGGFVRASSLVALKWVLMIPSEVFCVCQAADVDAAASFTFTLT